MKLKPNIRNKILLSFTAFAFLLLAVSVNFFYFQSKKNIFRRAEKSNRKIVKQLKEQFNRSIDNSFIELYGFSQIGVVQNNSSEAEKKIKSNIVNFLSVLPNKYSKIILLKPDSEKMSVFSPLRIFTGKITVEEKEEVISVLKKSVIRQISDSINAEKQIIKNIDKSGREILLVLQADKLSGLKLIAYLKIDKIADEALRSLSLNSSQFVFIVDKDKRIVYASDRKMINRRFKEIAPGIETGNSGGCGGFICSSTDYPRIGMKIIIRSDTASEIDELNKITKQAALFSLLIFLFVFAVVFFISGRISKSIESVKTAAENIAGGDFSHKIDVKRGDELGALIDAFNKMAENLKRSYDDLNVTNKELENKIEELTAARIELSEKQRLALVGETVSKISHEIQNKIGGVSIWVQNLELQLEEGNPLLDFVDEIKKSLNSFLEILMNFKKFYRRPPLQLGKIDIPELLKSVVGKYSFDVKRKNISVKTKFSNEGKIISADKNLLEEVFENVILNALFFTPENGEIFVEASFEKGKWKINICNDGPKIDAEPPTKIFEPFFTTKSSGSGLGLAISKNAVEAHGGTITVYNRKEGGVCFEIEIPDEISDG
ncbi:MAG: HAMP domain-containing histidine kinase [Chlorobi bacterium]|nr:HAMP domain-containing histidine kinase [Chlorobiota bacterium]